MAEADKYLPVLKAMEKGEKASAFGGGRLDYNQALTKTLTEILPEKRRSPK